MSLPENTKALPSANPDLANLAAIHKAKPKTKEVLERFKHRVKWEPDGRHFTIDLKTRKEIKEFSEMRDGYRRLAHGRASSRQAAMPVVRMKTKTGEVREVAAKMAHHAEKNGMQWAPARKPTHVYRDGRWWKKQAGEWVPE